MYLLELCRPTRSKVILIYLLSQKKDDITSVALSLELSHVKLDTFSNWEVWITDLCLKCRGMWGKYSTCFMAEKSDYPCNALNQRLF